MNLALLAFAFTAPHFTLGLAAIGLLGIATIYPGVMTPDAIQKLLGGPLVLIGASGAVDPHTAQRYVITKAGVAALTLAAPTPGADDGLRISIMSNTAFAHTVTSTGNYQTGVAGQVNLATFAAVPGACIELQAYNGKWNVQLQQAVVVT